MPLKPNRKAVVFDAAGQSADTDLLASNVTASEPPAIFTVTAAVSNSTAVRWKEFNGTTEKLYNLNNNATLDTNDLHSFDVPVRSGSEYNVQLHSATDVELLVVDEQSMEAE